MFQKGNKLAKLGTGSQRIERRITQRLKAALNEETEINGQTVKRIVAVVESLINRAVAGDVPAIREIFDRVDGKVPQETNLNVDDKRSRHDWTLGELADFLNDARAGGKGDDRPANGSAEPDSVH